jgi:hypothetical protein
VERGKIMKHGNILPAWGRILRGSYPTLSIEITRECPLRCPGCYAYEPQPDHDRCRAPARYQRIVLNIEGHSIQVHCTVTHQMAIRLTSPESPAECIFTRTTLSVTADLKNRITPCQFGGDPDSSRFGSPR